MKKSIVVLIFCFFVISNNLFAQKSEVKSQEPSFPGGKDAMLQYFADSLKLPEFVYKGKGGNIVLDVTINENGEVINPKIKYSFNALCNEETIRAVLAMPKWNPYIKNYQPKSTSVRIIVPFYVKRDKNFQFKRAQLYYELKRYDLAYLAASEAIKKDSVNLDVYKLLVGCCIKLNKQNIACAYLASGVQNGVKQCEEIYNSNCVNFEKDDFKKIIKKNELNTYDVDASFPEGEMALIQFICKNTFYPAADRENNIQGSVLLTFIIDETGEFLDIDIVNSVSFEMDNEALRVISKMPKFIPAKRNNINVPSRYTLPINFKLM